MTTTAKGNNLDYLAISEAFLALHEQDGFARLPPSSLLHPSVPMSFVMSAGLIQVENDLESIVAQTQGRFTFTQKCFRHFDVLQVGADSTHLSLFHMSAAFHIGVRERTAILPRLWRFMTVTLGLPSERLWVTYLDDAVFGLDTATRDCWREIGVDDSRLVGLDQQQCFWRQRETGKIARDGKKCGPHTEIFFERVEVACERCTRDRTLLGSCRCGRFVEVSNSLFIENYISDDGQLIPADTVFAECVIGAERLAMIVEGVPSVQGIRRFDALREPLLAMLPYHSVEQERSVSVIVDHVAAFAALVADGAPKPGKGGRAAIMRKLARGAMREMLHLGLDMVEVCRRLLPDGQARGYLLEEWVRFERTLAAELKRQMILTNSAENRVTK